MCQDNVECFDLHQLQRHTSTSENNVIELQTGKKTI